MMDLQKKITLYFDKLTFHIQNNNHFWLFSNKLYLLFDYCHLKCHSPRRPFRAQHEQLPDSDSKREFLMQVSNFPLLTKSRSIKRSWESYQDNFVTDLFWKTCCLLQLFLQERFCRSCRRCRDVFGGSVQVHDGVSRGLVIVWGRQRVKKLEAGLINTWNFGDGYFGTSFFIASTLKM